MVGLWPATWYFIIFLQLFYWSELASSAKFFQAKVNCPAKCGNVSVPYPFGIAMDRVKRGCSIDGVGSGYSINCNTTYDPPKPFMGNIEVISISDREIRVKNWLTARCFNQSGALLLDDFYTYVNFSSTPFTFSYTENKFFTLGCDTLGGLFMYDRQGKNYSSTCLAKCNERRDLKEGSCEIGGGCCKTPIRKGINMFMTVVVSSNNHTNVSSFDPCEYSFMAEEDQYSFAASDLLESSNLIKKVKDVPLVLDWAVGSETCEEAKKDMSTFACQANSFCNNTDNNPGYRCICNNGYEGNPYLSIGCQDINECEDQTNNPCVWSQSCTNTNGSFSCSCPSGASGDGRKNGDGCTTKSKVFPIKWVGIGVGLTVLLLVGGSYWLCFSIKNRRLDKQKRVLFQRNGGSLLKQQLSSNGVGVETANIFTAKELELATNNYDKDRIVGEGGYGTVYKGTLSNNRIVAIKKSKVVDQSQIEQFINELVILTQINHRNVVKLLGCCLETEVPLLVYEYVSNGTVYQHIHSKGNEMPSISWQSRLRIATETAGALAYLHSAASVPIIHRDIKSANILLDEKYNAKVSDFGASRLVPLEKTQFTTLVQGTLGYLDPEYFSSSQLTEKSDVYSFGVVLVEFLTGEKPISFERSEEQRNLSTYFISVLEDNKLFQVLEARVVNEGNPDQVLAVAELARRCLSLKGEGRPTMKEVARELEGLRKLEAQAWDRQLINNEKRTSSPSEPTDLYGVPSDYSIVFDSGQYSFDTSMMVSNSLAR